MASAGRDRALICFLSDERTAGPRSTTRTLGTAPFQEQFYMEREQRCRQKCLPRILPDRRRWFREEGFAGPVWRRPRPAGYSTGVSFSLSLTGLRAAFRRSRLYRRAMSWKRHSPAPDTLTLRRPRGCRPSRVQYPCDRGLDKRFVFFVLFFCLCSCCLLFFFVRQTRRARMDSLGICRRQPSITSS